MNNNENNNNDSYYSLTIPYLAFKFIENGQFIEAAKVWRALTINQKRELFNIIKLKCNDFGYLKCLLNILKGSK